MPPTNIPTVHTSDPLRYGDAPLEAAGRRSGAMYRAPLQCPQCTGAVEVRAEAGRGQASAGGSVMAGARHGRGGNAVGPHAGLNGLPGPMSPAGTSGCGHTSRARFTVFYSFLTQRASRWPGWWDSDAPDRDIANQPFSTQGYRFLSFSDRSGVERGGKTEKSGEVIYTDTESTDVNSRHGNQLRRSAGTEVDSEYQEPATF